MRVGFLAKKGIDSADNIDSPTAVLIDDKKVGIVVKAVIKRNEESFDTFFREFGVFPIISVEGKSIIGYYDYSMNQLPRLIRYTNI